MENVNFLSSFIVEFWWNLYFVPWRILAILTFGQCLVSHSVFIRLVKSSVAYASNDNNCFTKFVVNTEIIKLYCFDCFVPVWVKVATPTCLLGSHFVSMTPNRFVARKGLSCPKTHSFCATWRTVGCSSREDLHKFDNTLSFGSPKWRLVASQKKTGHLSSLFTPRSDSEKFKIRWHLNGVCIAYTWAFTPLLRKNYESSERILLFC